MLFLTACRFKASLVATLEAVLEEKEEQTAVTPFTLLTVIPLAVMEKMLVRVIALRVS